MVSSPKPSESLADWFQGELEESRKHPEFVLEYLVLRLTDQIVVAMQEQGVSRSELAERLDVSRAYITKVLSGHGNMTLRTLVRLSMALGLVPEVSLAPAEAQDVGAEEKPVRAADSVAVGSPG